jgi:hypothetical protein
MERAGLIGAMPMGGRWRSQGYIDGSTKYLGTFDTEEEAHEVFMREKERVAAVREKEAAEEVERILAGPTYVYEGGKGRGAALNGQHFKIVEAHGPHQAVVVPVDAEGIPSFSAQTKVSLAYLTEVAKPALDPQLAQTLAEEAAGWDSGKIKPGGWEPAPEAVPLARPVRVASVTVDPSATRDVRADVLRFATRTSCTDVSWAVEFAKKHARPEVAQVLAVLTGTAGIQQQLEWLRINTFVSSEVIREVEQSITSGLFMDESVMAAARALRREWPESQAPVDDDILDMYRVDIPD